MAKKPATSSAKKSSASARSTPVRNSAIPKAKSIKSTNAPRREPTHDEIARRAYEIYASGQGGSEHDNWIRAERELRGA